MNPRPLFCVVALLVGSQAILGAAPEKKAPKRELFDPARVPVIAAMLPDKPAGVGPTIADRAAWNKLAESSFGKELIPLADKFLKEPILDQPDELFLAYSQRGDRDVWQKVAFERRSRFAKLVQAECMQNQGRYLDKIRQYIEALCAETTWVYSAHDSSLKAFKGQSVDIDLGSSALCWQMATAAHLLGDKLDAKTRKLIQENLDKRSNQPYLDSLAGKRGPFFWSLATHNWNAVCIAGTIGTALASIEDKNDRAKFIAAAEKANEHFLAGFTPDGYCSEGLGYWNYGFGHYVLLTETVKQATAGKLDFLAHPKALAPARFAANIQIINGVAPAFADCGIYPKPDQHTMWYLNRRFGLGLTQHDKSGEAEPSRYIFQEVLYRFDNTMTRVAPAPATAAATLRTWFDSAGILICRPTPGSSTKLAVALKGGHNAEHHNHNDLGSFVVVVGDKCLVIDPGPETYTGRTFSSKRYDSKLLNSFGHPVPVIAGQLQKPGRDARAKIITSEFTDTKDTLVMDLTSAYPAQELVKLERAFVYDRSGAGSLTVTDTVEFSSPQNFGTALITLGKFGESKPGLLLEDGEQRVKVTIDTGGAPVEIGAEAIIEKARVKPTRVGVNLTEKVKSAKITMTFAPN